MQMCHTTSPGKRQVCRGLGCRLGFTLASLTASPRPAAKNTAFATIQKQPTRFAEPLFPVQHFANC